MFMHVLERGSVKSVALCNEETGHFVVPCTFSSFHLSVGHVRVTGTVTVCSLEGISHYCAFSFGLFRD